MSAWSPIEVALRVTYTISGCLYSESQTIVRVGTQVEPTLYEYRPSSSE